MHDWVGATAGDDTTSMGTSLFDLGLTYFSIKVPIGFQKVEVSKTSQLGVRTTNQLNKQGIRVSIGC